ncbi:SRPBCC family protein [Sphingomonas nostoxanthinifaciens]|uniref:SRPBCC family protein n=1 Tax=Sphingomonas nostoxanthinifaciens TaxID=2872652 RepID=UPI001CC1CA50|nr:SRPBCC family protein [Sphingomonas nostoxanthinifaciens]UAK24776.1 SRPBCC family protein [Sphingomonas nostoxanthinifaciens]
MAKPVALLAAATVAAVAMTACATDYVAVRNEVTVERPIDAVWARIGGWCAIADWLKLTCETVSGSGDVGSVRRLNGTTLEAMVGRTAHSYSYWQTAGNMAGFAYHGTLAAEPAGPTRTTLVYTLFYDQAAMPSDAVRASEHQRLQTRFAGALAAMKQLAETH